MDMKVAREIALEYFTSSEEAFEANDFLKARQLAESSSELFGLLNDHLYLAKICNLLGKIEGHSGKEIESIGFFVDGLYIAERYDYDELVLQFYNNIGFRYLSIQQYEKARIFLWKSNTILERIVIKDPLKREYYKLKLYTNLFDAYVPERNTIMLGECLNVIKEICYTTNNEEFNCAYNIRKVIYNWCENTEDEQLKDNVIKNLENQEYKNFVWAEMPLLSRFFLDIKDYTRCKKIVLQYEKYAELSNNLDSRMRAKYYHLLLSEESEDITTYQQLSIQYVKLSFEKKKQEKREKSIAFDSKIAYKLNEEARIRAESIVGKDALTSIKSRYSLDREGTDLLIFSAMEKIQISVGMIDVDFFKQINDTYGHVHGDEVLIQIANVIAACVEGYGSAYRLGGDEFVVTLKEVCKSTLLKVATTIQNKVKQIQIDNELIGPISVSQGYICFIAHKGDELSKYISYADKELYFVKENGKDDISIKYL